MDQNDRVGGDVRADVGNRIRQRHDALAATITTAIDTCAAALSPEDRRGLAAALLRLMTLSIDNGILDAESAATRELARYSPPLTPRDVIEAAQATERAVLDEVAIDERFGVTSERWAAVSHVIRGATLEIVGTHAEQVSGREAPIHVRDPLTTLIAFPVFELALSQEIERAVRHRHALALLLFDIDDLSQINRAHGWGVGDRLLERTGILARRFFRTHDWVARHDGDGIVVLLPETTLDQAERLASAFCDTVQQRLVLQDHNGGASRIVTMNGAAVGMEVVEVDVDAGRIMAEAEAALLRGRLTGSRRVERVALLPTSLTILGAASMLGRTPREIANLIRRGTLTATRRGRHYHIDRALLEAYRRSARDSTTGGH